MKIVTFKINKNKFVIDEIIEQVVLAPAIVIKKTLYSSKIGLRP